MRRAIAAILLASAIVATSFLPAPSEGETITLAATTTTDNSGLLAFLLPRFEAATGIKVRVVVQGTGAVLRLGQSGDVDVMLVHDPQSETAFMASGAGWIRREVMASEFLIVGPDADPAGIRGLDDADLALRRIAEARALFASRADDSGTHKAEQRLWRAAGVDPRSASGEWYRETGAGMGATLNIASGLGAYALTENATWLSFGNRKGLEALVAGDPRFINPYGIIVVNPSRHPHVREVAARRFVDWLTSAPGQAAIA
ncbi:MAG: substrate-binding domain-containing protein, partial [Alphaproteobacteria bacterium]